MKRGIIYRALKPKWWVFILKIILTFIAFIPVTAMMIAAFCEYINSGNYTELFIVGITSIILYAIIAVIVIKSLKNEKRALSSRSERLGLLDTASLERLEEEVQAAEFHFKSIYVLDNYLFVPKAGLLLDYGSIKSYKTIYHSTNSIPDAVFVEIFDINNVKYFFSVKKWREYKKGYYDFMELLEKKGVFSNAENAAVQG